MKKNVPMKSPSKRQEHTGVLGIIRAYLSVIRILHRNLGAPRIIAAYVFFAFAVLSLSFTIRVPVSSHFLPPTEGAKAQSRVITGFIMLINLLVYGMIMNWRKASVFYISIRAAFICLALYLDVRLAQIVYILMRDGMFF